MVDSKVGVDQAPTPAESVDQSGSTPDSGRLQLLRPWLIALAVIPFLLALIDYGAYERPTAVNGPTGELPVLSTASVSLSLPPSLALSLISVSRNGNSVTLIGDITDEPSKAALIKALKGLLAPGVNIVDQIRIDPQVRTLDFANAEPIFTAGAPIPDFTFRVEKDTVTLNGTAPTADAKDAVGRATAGLWPFVNVSNKIVAKGNITPTAPGAPPAPPTPGPPTAAACSDMQATINALTGGPLAFGNDGVSLTPEDNTILIRVADKLKACPNIHVTINGYTDNAGSEAINIPLSTQRATVVAEYLIANGVPRDRVTAKGMGSANPIAGNDTAEGRIKNRRVEIAVG